MAKAKAYRRKNRQIKVTLDIPDDYKDDEEFASDLMELLDEDEWELFSTPVHKINIGDVEIAPE